MSNYFDAEIRTIEGAELPLEIIDFSKKMLPEELHCQIEKSSMHLHAQIKCLGDYILELAKKYDGLVMKYSNEGSHYQAVSIEVSKNGIWNPVAEYSRSDEINSEVMNELVKVKKELVSSEDIGKFNETMPTFEKLLGCKESDIVLPR